MATWFLDYEGGNDSADGKSFANRRKTITGLTAAVGLAAGDTVRLMASFDPTLVGNATWTQYSKNVVLAAAVTQMIADCETVWTASANVTTSKNGGSFKENTGAANIAIAAAFTTGKVAYFPTGTLDLSGYQQVSFWIQNNVAIAANTLSLRLCSDAAGATPVHTIAIPAIPSTGQFLPVTVDLGANMNSAVQSIALYQDVDIAAVTVILDNIIACKASSAPDSLSLTSLIGKVCNLSWTASTTYTAGDQRRPTQSNRNGFRYQASSGTTAAAEPTWPLEAGLTVLDGTVTWTCIGLEDTWFGIQSINGSTVKLDNTVNTTGSAGRGYAGSSETVATYKRETIKTTMVSSATTAVNTPQKAGTDALPVTYAGGWNRTDMSTQTGETWFDGQNGLGYAIVYTTAGSFQTLSNLNGVRYHIGLQEWGIGARLSNMHWNNCTFYGFAWSSANPSGNGTGLCANNNGLIGLNGNNPGSITLKQCSFESNNSNSGISLGGGYRLELNASYVNLRNNSSFGGSILTTGDVVIQNAVTGNNGSNAFTFTGANAAAYAVRLLNCLLPESTPFSALSALAGNQYIYSQKHNQIADNHLITTDGGVITSAVDQRHSPSGIAWKFRPTSTNRSSAYPLRLSVAKIACAANATVSVAIWTRRDNANIKGQLFVAGGQLTGMPNDLAVDCTPTVNTWAQSDTLSFTPTENGVVEVVFRVWDGVGATNNFWIDDLSVG
jgi:hypothetical protein